MFRCFQVLTKSITRWLRKYPRNCHQIAATRRSSRSEPPQLIGFVISLRLTLDDDPRSSIPSRITQLAGAEPETPASSRSAMYAPEMRKRKPSSGHESETSPNKKRSRSVRSLPETPSMIEEITS
ncbi:hypothetical protein L208DRAFT_314028 [Tricholoma matsutake]|nr:hypothetical protein L208DRAFT_314028 [Tricholoma matsutake 945]